MGGEKFQTVNKVHLNKLILNTEMSFLTKLASSSISSELSDELESNEVEEWVLSFSFRSILPQRENNNAMQLGKLSGKLTIAN